MTDYINKVTIADTPYDINSFKTNGVFYGNVNSSSTATDFTATVEGLSSLTNGTIVVLHNGIVTSASGFTINVNNLGDKPVYSNLATGNDITPTAPTRDTTIFNINYTMMFIYDADLVNGGAWICYRGYDANTNTIGYQLRGNSGTRPAADKGYRYRLWLSSADNQSWVPINTSTATDATTSRALNTRAIDPFGEIVYYSTNGTTNATANLTATTIWQQYTLSIGYSYVKTLTAWDPVYLKCQPQSNGSAVMKDIVQILPTTNDGYIYIYLGIAYSTTAMELRFYHPVYYHDGTGIRIWTGKTIPTKTSDLTNDSGFITDAGVTSFNGSIGAITYTAPVTSVNGSTGAITGLATTSQIPAASTTTPLVDGTASYGSGTAYARANHVHPTDTSRQATLVSGTNIKTINNNSLLGSGNLTITVPTATSDLTNDSGFITDSDIPEGAAKYTSAPSNIGTAAVTGTSNAFSPGDHVHAITGATITAALGYTPYNSTNPNGYTSNIGTVTSVKVNGTSKTPTNGVVDIGTVLTSYTETDPTVPSWAKAASKPSYTASEVGALPNTTVIPTATSDLTNDSGFITGYTETDPTVPSWAKESTKPSYTASEVGAATSTHAHGNITNAGDITATSTIASGDRLVINDEGSSKITNSSITFGNSTSTFLANNGTWQTPGSAVSSVNGMTGAVTVTQADVEVPEIAISSSIGGYYTTYGDGIKYLTISPSSSNFYIGAGLKDTLSSEDTVWITLDTRIAETSMTLSSGSVGSGKTLYLRRCGHMVHAYMGNAVAIASGKNNSALSCGTIPEGYRPEHNEYMGGPAVSNNSINGYYRWMIVPGGAITLVSSVTGTREEPISMTWYTSNDWPT